MHKDWLVLNQEAAQPTPGNTHSQPSPIPPGTQVLLTHICLPYSRDAGWALKGKESRGSVLSPGTLLYSTHTHEHTGMHTCMLSAHVCSPSTHACTPPAKRMSYLFWVGMERNMKMGIPKTMLAPPFPPAQTYS